MRDKHPSDYWQSFADLAMGLMAVILLILVVLLVKVRDDAKDTAVKAKELAKVAEMLLTAISDAEQVQKDQEGVSEWVSHVFKDQLCGLRYDFATGRLLPPKRSGKGDDDAQLYDLGAVELSKAARDNLKKCKNAFITLMACMSPKGSEQRKRCTYGDKEKWQQQEAEFRDGIEALVLQGNTDRVAPGDRNKHDLGIGRIERLPGKTKLSGLSDSYVSNAYVGSERARQALGHLLQLVGDGQDSKPDSSYQNLLMALARVETASFGRYQVGPHERRKKHAASPDELACSPKSDECRQARNLSLQLRWRREQLRKPFAKVRDGFCKEWRKDGALHATLTGARAVEAEELCTAGGVAAVKEAN